MNEIYLFFSFERLGEVFYKILLGTVNVVKFISRDFFDTIL